MNIKMNKIWKLVIVALVITTSACGQQRGGQGGPPPQGGGQQGGSQQAPPALPTDDEIEEMVEDIAKEILLSDEQESNVLVLYKEHFEEVEGMTKSGRPDRDEMDELKEDFEDNVNAVLTKDQKKLYKSYLKNNKKERSLRK